MGMNHMFFSLQGECTLTPTDIILQFRSVMREARIQARTVPSSALSPTLDEDICDCCGSSEILLPGQASV